MKLIGLDVGEKRIGVAQADTTVRIAVPEGVIVVNGQEMIEIAKIAQKYHTESFVIGMPRNLQGQETAQSQYVRQFARQLKQTIPHAKIRFQDESLTSVEAEARLKSRKRNYQKGEIDTEAATIILQDFIESFNNAGLGTPVDSQSGALSNSADSSATQSTTDTYYDHLDQIAAAKSQDGHLDQNAAAKSQDGHLNQDPVTKSQKDTTAMSKRSKSRKKSHLAKTIGLTAAIVVVLLGIGGLVATSWYNSALVAVADVTCTEDSAEDACQDIEFLVRENEYVSQIADNLQASGLIRNALAFQIYARLNGFADQLKSGQYTFDKSLDVQTIVERMVKGVASSDVFNFTILPGETIADIKKKLKEIGYTTDAIDTAFEKSYDSPVLASRPTDDSQPASVALEGYLFGETYQFYKGESVENIIKRALNQMNEVVEKNNLVAEYKAQGLTLHEGITLASIVQKEAHTNDQPTVAQVFLSRLRQGLPLGSDVTATYAADLIDPTRSTLKDNAAVLATDSHYNTRKYTGLPPGPISSPSISALQAVAHPSDTDYLYFLTGDDGMMYYGYTEAEHDQNIRDHCKTLCNVAL